MLVLGTSELQQHSTEAARAYVLSTRDLLRAERAREGQAALQRRSYRSLQASLAPEQLSRTWPHADLERALAE